MAELIKTLNIWELGKKSQRGYFFKEPAVREFLDSETWAKRKQERTAMCLLTHYSRRQSKDERDSKAVGQMDYQLIDQTTVGTVLDMYIESGFWRCKVLIFDPQKFQGSKALEDIAYVRGLIESGVKLQASAGIKSYYNPVTNEGEKIYDFVGIDFTQSPDMLNAGIID